MSKKPAKYGNDFLRTETHQKRMFTRSGLEREGERMVRRAKHRIDPSYKITDTGPHFEIVLTGGMRE